MKILIVLFAALIIIIIDLVYLIRHSHKNDYLSKGFCPHCHTELDNGHCHKCGEVWGRMP
jgi:hypothetical protein